MFHGDSHYRYRCREDCLSLVGVNTLGEVVVCKKCSWNQLLHFTSNFRECLIDMKACGGSHFLGRALREQGTMCA